MGRHGRVGALWAVGLERPLAVVTAPGPRGGSYRPYCFILRQSVVRLMPRSRAASARR